MTRQLFTTGPLRGRGPVPRHRSSQRPRVGSFLGGLLLLAVVVVAGGAVAGSQLSVDERYREFVRTGSPGEPVSVHGFDATVLQVRTAAEVSDGPSWGRDTDGVWVLVRIRVVAEQEPASVRYAAVRDRQGRVYQPSNRVDQPLAGLNGHQLQPGIPVEGDVVFEVPQPAATGLTLRLAGAADLDLATVAEVPLPVDTAMVDGGLATSEPVFLAEAEIAPAGAAPADAEAPR